MIYSILAACPPVYTLPGTWDDPEKIKRCQDTLIPHLNLEPETGFLVFIGLLVLISIVYGIYMTFGAGGKNLKDEIRDHARMHELGIAHGHNEKGAFPSVKTKHQHKHNNV